MLINSDIAGHEIRFLINITKGKITFK